MSGFIQEVWVSEGFEEADTFVALLPHRVLRVDLELLEDRQLKASETTVLSLISEGVVDPDAITSLMGLPDDRLVVGVIVDMLARAALWKGAAGLEVTDHGKALLRQGRIRRTRHIAEALRYDPWCARLEWRMDGELSGQLGRIPQIPIIRDVDERALTARLPELQRLLAHEGLPEDEQRKGEKPANREFLSLQVIDAYLAVRRVTVGIWRRQDESGDERLRVERDGIEDEPATRALATFRFHRGTGEFRQRA